MNGRDPTIAALWRARPRNRFLRGSLLAMALLTIVVSFTGGWSLAIDARRLEIIARFLRDIVPAPLREAPSDFGAGLTWAATIMDEGGWQAMVDTVAISVLAIVLAMSFGGLLALPAARNLAHPEPFLPGPRPPSPLHLAAWRLVVFLSRSLLIIVRAIPEYVWAFLLVATIGLDPWAAILALAIHNAGILGRLSSEIVENLPAVQPAALRGIGASRAQIVVFAVLPQGFGRALLYFFYRWETCIREAAVLGMLGIASLGWLIHEASSLYRYDEVFFLILVGALLVVLVDLLSTVARAVVRRAD